MKNFLFLSLVFILSKGFAQNIVYRTESLDIIQLTETSFVHISYLNTDDFGKVACNGLVVLDQGKAFVLDTPVDNESASELLEWLETTKRAKVEGVLATHFHNDCLGGLHAFHRKNIPSFASHKTIDLAKLTGYEVPRTGFETEKEWKIGDKTIQAVFLGEGHTRDNVVCQIREDKVLFGGCLVKEVGASKGFLGDANLKDWSNTIDKVRIRFSTNRWVVPGHGKAGGDELLEYTAKLFR